jgi:hypothetical protein
MGTISVPKVGPEVHIYFPQIFCYGIEWVPAIIVFGFVSDIFFDSLKKGQSGLWTFRFVP